MIVFHYRESMINLPFDKTFFSSKTWLKEAGFLLSSRYSPPYNLMSADSPTGPGTPTKMFVFLPLSFGNKIYSTTASIFFHNKITGLYKPAEIATCSSTLEHMSVRVYIHTLLRNRQCFFYKVSRQLLGRWIDHQFGMSRSTLFTRWAML
jgi:hypothetical protein